MSDYDAMQNIRSTAPAACELEDCHDMETAVRRLIEFAHQAVSGSREASQVNCDDRVTIGFLVGCLEGLQYRVDPDASAVIESALNRAKSQYSA